MTTELVRKDSIEELAGHRARALELYAQAFRTLQAAREAHGRACHGQHIGGEFMRDLRYYLSDQDFGRFVMGARKEIDRSMWRYFIDATPLGSLMDGEERKRFEDGLKDDPPEATPDTVFATLSRLAGEADVIFRRGLVNAFRRFCGDYKSHDGFKIGPRFVVESLVSGSGPFFHVNHWRDDMVRDIDRCMHVLDGKPSPEYQEGILAAIRTAIQARQQEAKTEYWRVRLFYGNGNAHFYPLRDDLVRKANLLIAQHFGETLGAGPSARAA